MAHPLGREASRADRHMGPRTGIALGAAISISALSAAVAVSAAAVAPAHSARFTFSGSLRGTLHGDPCGGTPTLGGQFEFDASTLKGSKADTWTVNVNIGTAKAGTYKNIRPNSVGVAPASVVLLGQTASKEYDWLSTSGPITTTKTAGSVNVTLGPDRTFSGVPGKGIVHISGSWNCPADS